MDEESCVIVGASHAGVQLALSLRQGGWAGRIIVIGEEAEFPYHRPPLSKDLLAGKKAIDEIRIRPAKVFEQSAVELRLGQKAVEINREDGTLRLDTGQCQRYDALALTTGSRARTIPLMGSETEGVFYLRSSKDVGRIRRRVVAGRRAVIIGGGYIGLEAAAVLQGIGMRVTVLEMMPRILQRVTAPLVSSFFERIHGEEGVQIITGAVVERISGDGKIEKVHCADGSEFGADLVIIATGIVPNVELAISAGLAVDDGIVVDEFCRSSDHRIMAAGDCSRFFDRRYQRTLRLESIQNANDQAKTAAAMLCGNPTQHDALPWFWSDQYDVKLQIAGLFQGYDDVVVRGDPDTGRSFAAFYFAGERLLAVDAINRPAEFMAGKRLLQQGASVDKKRLADDSLALRDLL